MTIKEVFEQYGHLFQTDYTADANCEGAYLLSEGTGTTAADSSGEGLTFTFKGSGEPAWDSNGKPNTHYTNSIKFDGTDDYAYHDDDTKLGLDAGEGTILCWFNGDTIDTSGEHTIMSKWGANSSTRPYRFEINTDGKLSAIINQGITNTKYAISEGVGNEFTTIKQIARVAIDEFNPDKRVIYLTPGNRSYKWSQTNVTSIAALGKIGYGEDFTTGVDGYLYYTGLLRKVQRIIDGFEPDPTNFPGRKAVGSLIEVLPPLPRRITVAIDVTTQDGINLSEISDEITSVIINYISDLGVGEDVILSDIIVRVKNIDGVAAVTFITPEPSEERIPISSDEKAFTENSDISIA